MLHLSEGSYKPLAGVYQVLLISTDGSDSDVTSGRDSYLVAHVSADRRRVWTSRRIRPRSARDADRAPAGCRRWMKAAREKRASRRCGGSPVLSDSESADRPPGVCHYAQRFPRLFLDDTLCVVHASLSCRQPMADKSGRVDRDASRIQFLFCSSLLFVTSVFRFRESPAWPPGRGRPFESARQMSK